jgi:hypothetical protein
MFAALAATFMWAVASNATAEQSDLTTKITINKTFAVPGKVLPPGTYVFRLMDTTAGRRVVQILNADESDTVAIVLAIPDYRLNAGEGSRVSFYEAPPGAPLPLHAWFFPGRHYGVEFAYPKTKAVEIATTSGEHVIAIAGPETTVEASAARLRTLPLIAIDPTGKEAGLATVHPAPGPGVADAEPALSEPTLIAQAELPKELPRTASPLYLLALAGLLAGAGAGIVRAFRKN